MILFTFARRFVHCPLPPVRARVWPSPSLACQISVPFFGVANISPPPALSLLLIVLVAAVDAAAAIVHYA